MYDNNYENRPHPPDYAKFLILTHTDSISANSMAELAREKAIQIIEAYFNGVYDGEVDNVPLHPEVTFQGTMVENEIKGEGQVRAFLADLAAAFDETDVVFVRDIIDGNFVCSEVQLKMSNGKVVHLCDIFEIQDELIKSVRPYFDPRPMLGE